MEEAHTSFMHDVFFQKDNPRNLKSFDPDSTNFFKHTPSPFLLEMANKIGMLFFLNKQDLCALPHKKLEDVLLKNIRRSLDEYDFSSESERHLTMLRISPCERFLAVVFPSNLAIVSLADFLKDEVPQTKASYEFDKQRECTYLEWPPLSNLFIATPYYLTLDSSNKLRVHAVDNDTIISNLDEEFRCVTFSNDGKYIIGIHYTQELVILDAFSLEVVIKKKIPEISDSRVALSTQILQISSKTIAVGSLYKNPRDEMKDSQPTLHLLGGDFFDSTQNITILVYPMALDRGFTEDQLPVFKFSYIKERDLLLYSHTHSSHVHAIQIETNGNVNRLNPLDLVGSYVRGFAFFKVALSREDKTRMVDVEHNNRRFRLPNPPRVLILDSEGTIHQFCFYDTRFSLKEQSLLDDPVKPEMLNDFKITASVLVHQPENPFQGVPSMGIAQQGGMQDESELRARNRAPRMMEDEMNMNTDSRSQNPFQSMLHGNRGLDGRELRSSMDLLPKNNNMNNPMSMAERQQLIPPSQQQTINERRIFKIDDRGLKGLDPYKTSMESGNSLLRMSNPTGARPSNTGSNLSTMMPPQSNILPNQRPSMTTQSFQNSQNPFGNMNTSNNLQPQSQTVPQGFPNQQSRPQNTGMLPMQTAPESNNFLPTSFKSTSQPTIGSGSFLSQTSQQNNNAGARPPGFVASGWPQSQPQTQLKPQIQQQNQGQMNLLSQNQQMQGGFKNPLQRNPPSMTDITMPGQNTKPAQDNVLNELIKNMQQRLNEKKNIFKRPSKDYSELQRELEIAAKNSSETINGMKGVVDKLRGSRFEKFYQFTKEISQANLFLETIVKETDTNLDNKRKSLVNGSPDEKNEIELGDATAKNKKKMEKIEKNLKVFEKFIENQHRLTTLSPSYQPRKIEYHSVEKSEQFVERGKSRLGKSTLTKSFKDSVEERKQLNQRRFILHEKVSEGEGKSEPPKTGLLVSSQLATSMIQSHTRVEAPISGKKEQVERALRTKELCELLLNEKSSMIQEMMNKVKKLRKLRNKNKKSHSKRGVMFPETLSDGEDEEEEDQRPTENLSQSVMGIDRSSLETSFRAARFSEEKKEKFFSDLLLELSNRTHPHELTRLLGYTTSIVKPDPDVYNLIGSFKMREPQLAKTLSPELNTILQKAVEDQKKEIEKLKEQRRIAEEKAKKEKEAREAEERRKVEEARKKAEEEAKRKAAEDEAKRKAAAEAEARRKEEEKKKAEEQAKAAAAAQAQAQANTNASAAPGAGAGAGAGPSQDDAMKEYMLKNLEMSPAEIQELEQMGNLITPLRSEMSRLGLDPAKAVFIVTLKGVPMSWTNDVAKQKLTQLRKKFDNLKQEVKENVNTVLLRVTGFADAVQCLVLRGQNIEGNVIQVELILAQKQPGAQASPAQPQGQGQAQQQKPATGGMSLLGQQGQGQGQQQRPNTGMGMGMGMGMQTQNQQQQKSGMGMGMGMQAQQQSGGNMFQLSQNKQAEAPKFGQTSQAGSNPMFGQTGGNKPAFGTSGGAAFGQSGGAPAFGKPAFGQSGGMGGGMQTQQSQMKPGGFGSFGAGSGGSGSGGGQSFMGFTGAVQQNKGGPSFGASGGGPSFGASGGGGMSSFLSAPRK